jgi:outer membrane protein assembly factor BamE (lipoprotein component of BamABCDE complex)
MRDDDEVAKKPGVPLWAWVAMGVTILFALAACGAFAVYTLASRKPPAGQEVKKTYTREEFRKLIVGKGQDEVIATVGRPDTTQDSGRNPTWYYRNLTVDPITGKTDHSAQVIFKNGVVDHVNY